LKFNSNSCGAGLTKVKAMADSGVAKRSERPATKPRALSSRRSRAVRAIAGTLTRVERIRADFLI